MPRYLTPGRVCLLVLIDVHLAGDAASSVRLDVLSYIASRVLTAARHDQADVRELLRHMSNDASAWSTQLTQWPSVVPGRSLYDIFLQRLWSFGGLDSFHVLFDQLGQLTTPLLPDSKYPRGLSRASPIGQFIRRCRIEATRLQFADYQALWDEFVLFRSPTYESWAQRNPDAAKRLEIEKQQSGIFDSSGGVILSTDVLEVSASAEDANNLLAVSVHQLQKLGTRLPDELKNKLQEWILDQWDFGAQSLQYFLAFFEHWRAGQYTMALESIHRYFDYSLVTRSASENMRVYYQYALLHLSVLHADFDCWEESAEAMDECIATARENQDTTCLNFALSWLLYLRQAKPSSCHLPFGAVSGVTGTGNGSEYDEVEFLKAKAIDTRHWSLLSSALLEEARLEMLYSGSSLKAAAPIAQSEYLNVQHDLRVLMPATNLFLGTLFDRLGQRSVTARMYESTNAVLEEFSPVAHRVQSTCRVAYALAQTGHYGASLQLLQTATAKGQGVLKLEQKAIGFISLVQLTRSLRRDDHHASDYYLSQLLPLRDFGDPELEFEIQLREIDHLIKRQELERALKIVNSNIKRLKGGAGTDMAQQLQFLVLKARIFAAGGTSAKGFSIALRAASTALRKFLIPPLMEALAVLATILNNLMEFRAAEDLLQSALPQILESRQTHLAAECFLTLAESCVGIAGQANGSGLSQQSQYVRYAESYIERSREAFMKLEDLHGMLDCLSMRARLARWQNDETSASQADGLYAQIWADYNVI